MNSTRQRDPISRPFAGLSIRTKPAQVRVSKLAMTCAMGAMFGNVRVLEAGFCYPVAFDSARPLIHLALAKSDTVGDGICLYSFRSWRLPCAAVLVFSEPSFDQRSFHFHV